MCHMCHMCRARPSCSCPLAAFMPAKLQLPPVCLLPAHIGQAFRYSGMPGVARRTLGDKHNAGQQAVGRKDHRRAQTCSQIHSIDC